MVLYLEITDATYKEKILTVVSNTLTMKNMEEHIQASRNVNRFKSTLMQISLPSLNYLERKLHSILTTHHLYFKVENLELSYSWISILILAKEVFSLMLLVLRFRNR
jgi:hypothetical protein